MIEKPNNQGQQQAWTGHFALKSTQPRWRWDVFGNDGLRIELTTKPYWLRRLLWSILLGSKWKRLT